MQTLSFDQTQQVHHIACMAVLAMCARGVAASEFESSGEAGSVRVTVTRADGAEHAVDIEILNASGFALGGMSL